MTGMEPTGADLPSDGSSVEAEEGMAAEEYLPEVEEIVRTEPGRQTQIGLSPGSASEVGVWAVHVEQHAIKHQAETA